MKLNKSQQQATKTIDGPVMLIAGPGSGKTEIIARRIMEMLSSENHQIDPQCILCFTFTDAGAVAMRKRLVQKIGNEAYKVKIITFHAFCNEIVQNNLDYFGVRDLEAITDIETEAILKEIIDELDIKHPLKRVKGDIYYDSYRLKNLFKIMKEENWTPEFVSNKASEYIESLKDNPDYLYKKANQKKGINVGDIKQELVNKEKDHMVKLIAASELVTKYNDKMKAANRYDFTDMIQWVIKGFSDEKSEMLLINQEKYQYVMVDESQDTNGSQFDIIRLLMSFWEGEQPNIFIVGDDYQCIYGFQGARLNNLLDFYKRYDPVVIPMTDNYRSSESVVSAANRLIGFNQTSLAKQIEGVDKSLKSANKDIPNISPEILEFKNIAQEEQYIVDQIKKLWGSGIKDIGIIYRKHSQADNIIKELQINNIPVNVKRRLNILHEPIVNQIMNIFTYIVKESEIPNNGAGLLFPMFHYPYFKGNRKEIENLYINTPYGQRALDIYNENTYPSLKKPIEFLNNLIEEYHNMPVISTLEKIIKESGLLEYVMSKDNKHQLMIIINTLFNWIKKEVKKNPVIKGQQVVDLINIMIQKNIPIPVENIGYAEEGVNLMTAHGSKGLEFEHVFILGCVRSQWEKSRVVTNTFKIPDTISCEAEESQLEASRRLFYVAMTRAKSNLTITYSLKTNDDKDLEPSQFIDETGIQVTEGKLETELYNHISDQLTFMEPVVKLESEVIDKALENYRISVSHINKYLDCPVSFYYENIIKVPFIATSALILGNATHASLQTYYNTWRIKGKSPSINQLNNWYIGDLDKNKGQLSIEDYNRLYYSGLEYLQGYYNMFIINSRSDTLNEYRLTNIVIDGIPIKIIIDKLEFEGNIVDAFDYKTGNAANVLKRCEAPSAKNPIGGEYWRQSVMTKIAIDNLQTKPWKIRNVYVDIIDDDMQRKNIPITREDELFVIKQMKDVYNSIMNHEFDKGCEKEHCKWCNFVKSLNN